MVKMNKVVGDNNRLDKSVGKKHLALPSFLRKELWKCIGCIISSVKYGKKGHKLWGTNSIFFVKTPQTKLH